MTTKNGGTPISVKKWQMTLLLPTWGEKICTVFHINVFLGFMHTFKMATKNAGKYFLLKVACEYFDTVSRKFCQNCSVLYHFQYK